MLFVHSVTAGAIQTKLGVVPHHVPWHVLGYLYPRNTSPGGTPLFEEERGFYWEKFVCKAGYPQVAVHQLSAWRCLAPELVPDN